MLGKGGVGKSMVSAAIAKMLAASGTHALIMECDTRAPLAQVFGVAASFEPQEVAPDISLMTLDGRRADSRSICASWCRSRMLLKAVFASRLYQFFVQAAPGLRELMMLGKIYYEAGRNTAKASHRGVIIVDAPASGQAMSLLKMPTAARTTFTDSVVGKEASNISKMLRDRRHCAIVQVTTADALSVAETNRDSRRALSRIHLAPAAVFFNRMVASDFDANDIASLANGRGVRALRKKQCLSILRNSPGWELRRGSKLAAQSWRFAPRRAVR